jgi:hypothetical protein
VRDGDVLVEGRLVVVLVLGANPLLQPAPPLRVHHLVPRRRGRPPDAQLLLSGMEDKTLVTSIRFVSDWEEEELTFWMDAYWSARTRFKAASSLLLTMALISSFEKMLLSHPPLPPPGPSSCTRSQRRRRRRNTFNFGCTGQRDRQRYARRGRGWMLSIGSVMEFCTKD